VFARGQGATLYKFDGDDPDNLIEALNATAPGGGRLVCIDGVNSMTGNVPDLPTLARICRDHDALLYVDDAHGFGLIGERHEDEPNPYGLRGNSVVRHAGESYDNIILVGGFSKAFSSLLAFVALPTWLKNHLKVAAPPYLYSGPSPTASLASVLAGFDVNEARGDALRTKLYRLSRTVLDEVRRVGIATPNVHDTPIIELLTTGEEELAVVAAELWRRGIYVTLAAYPLVPHDQVGIRVQLTAAHTGDEVTELLDALRALDEKGLLRHV
jgi:8-amino-7-oxononanoate synthase